MTEQSAESGERRIDMAHTVQEFHGLLADHLVRARRRYDARPAPGEPGYLDLDSQDAVTEWRHLAHIASIYANGSAVKGKRPTWEAFWKDGMSRADYVRLLDRRSRILRCVGDVDATLFDDSVRFWEYTLTNAIMNSYAYAEAAEVSGSLEALHRERREFEVSLSVASAYTGQEVDTLRRLVSMCDQRPNYPGRGPDGRTWESHLLLDLIAENRPTFPA